MCRRKEPPLLHHLQFPFFLHKSEHVFVDLGNLEFLRNKLQVYVISCKKSFTMRVGQTAEPVSLDLKPQRLEVFMETESLPANSKSGIVKLSWKLGASQQTPNLVVQVLQNLLYKL